MNYGTESHPTTTRLGLHAVFERRVIVFCVCCPKNTLSENGGWLITVVIFQYSFFFLGGGGRHVIALRNGMPKRWVVKAIGLGIALNYIKAVLHWANLFFMRTEKKLK